MIKKVLLPKLGQTMEEATIEKWHAAEGDKITKGDILLEITTDKATLEVESFAEGVLRKILHEAGEVLPVNTVLALMTDTSDEEITDDVLADAMKLPEGAAQAQPAGGEPSQALVASAARSPVAEAPATPNAPVPRPAAPAGRIFASPRAKKAAREFDVPLSVLIGSGPDGRIVEANVLHYLDEVAPKKPTPVARKLALQRGIDLRRIDAVPVTKEDVEQAVPAAPAGQEVPFGAMRRIIAERMTYAKQHIPHFSIMIDVNMSAVVDLRKKLNVAGEGKISYNDIIMAACAAAYREVPAMTVLWDGGKAIKAGSLDYGVAVAIPDGLIVPVVRGVERKGIRRIAEISRDLIERARSKKLLPDEYEGGLMTISNLGMYPITAFTPIINPGQNCILGIGAIIDRVVPVGDAIGIRSMCCVTAAFDHRVIDGAIAAPFMDALKHKLEDPSGLPV